MAQKLDLLQPSQQAGKVAVPQRPAPSGVCSLYCVPLGWNMHGCASSGAQDGGSSRSLRSVGVVGSDVCGRLRLDAYRPLRLVTFFGLSVPRPDLEGRSPSLPAGAAGVRIQPLELRSESVGFHKAILYEHVVRLGMCVWCIDGLISPYRGVPR